MSLHERKHGGESNKTVFTHLADGRRRKIVAVLRASEEPVHEHALANELAREAPAANETGDTTERARVALEHRHLPALEGAGLVEREDETVAPTNHPALRDPAVLRLIETESDDVDDLIQCLAHERRRRALAILHERDGLLPGAVLAQEVAALECEGTPSTEDVEAVRCSLHHVHLPKLRAADLIEYDTEADLVAYRGHPELAARLFRTRPWDGAPVGQPGVVY